MVNLTDNADARRANVRGMHCLANGIRLHYLDFNHTAVGAPILLLLE